ncbi:MAG: tetratricopeptide repeat protein [Spirochaetia bacterium]
MKNQGLKKAERLFASARYSDVIHVLEPQVFMYRETPRFYYLLGMSCMYMGDLGGAYSYLSRSAQLDPNDTGALLGLAAVHVRRNETQDALRLWLDVLDVEPRNRQARRGLSVLREAQSQAEIQQNFSNARIKKFLPGRGFPVRRVLVAAGGGAAVAAVAAGVLFVPWGDLTSGMFTRQPQEQREGGEILNVDTEGEQLIQYSGDFRYVLTDEEVGELFEEIRDHFHGGRDNLAQREINRLLLSNASADLKERALLVTDYLREPGFTDFEHNFSYEEVDDEPRLYDGCYVRWSGRAANVNVGEEAIEFDLLVGYEDGRVLQGVVPVQLDFSARVESGMSVELIGEISADGEINGIRGVAVRMIDGGSD